MPIIHGKKESGTRKGAKWGEKNDRSYRFILPEKLLQACNGFLVCLVPHFRRNLQLSQQIHNKPQIQIFNHRSFQEKKKSSIPPKNFFLIILTIKTKTQIDQNKYTNDYRILLMLVSLSDRRYIKNTTRNARAIDTEFDQIEKKK